jgi:hypothetical protein
MTYYAINSNSNSSKILQENNNNPPPIVLPNSYIVKLKDTIGAFAANSDVMSKAVSKSPEDTNFATLFFW